MLALFCSLGQVVALRMMQMSSTGTITPKSSTPLGAATVLRCEGLSKSFTGIPQFRDISLTLGKGQRLGLIGINGG